MTSRQRLDALEAAHWRQMIAEMVPPGITLDAVLEACIHFLTMPPDEQRREYPDYTEDERREMSTWLPAIRRARWGHRRPRG
jgi:hypothetical protein